MNSRFWGRVGDDSTAGYRAAVGEVGEVPNLGTCHFGETMLIRLFVHLGAEPHSPVARSDKPKETSAVVALVPGHYLLLNRRTKQVEADRLVPDRRVL
jgi:hypothetical protein